MSKRMTFTDFEIQQLVKGLEDLKNYTTLDYEVIKVGQRFYQQLIDKLQPPLKPVNQAMGVNRGLTKPSHKTD